MLPYRDRVVLQAIMMILAPIADECLSDRVWSWRVKRDLRGKSPDQITKAGLFNETDISDFPFLKKKTVNTYIEEFEPWYALWPQFDIETRATLADPSFKWMLFTDISGYFENIQIGMLKDLLSQLVPGAPNTINLLIRHLRAWCQPTHDGSTADRGIPQGNAVSSFLGNIFLKPIDDHFEFFFDTENVKYFRYMDDIRIVARTKDDARNAALALETRIRHCQLNLQSSKTKLLSSEEALLEINDSRLERLDRIIHQPRGDRPRAVVLKELSEVYADRGDSKDSKSLRDRPLKGLSLRTLRRWAQAHYDIGSRVPLARVSDEVLLNPDYKVTRELLKISRRFPESQRTAAKVSAFVCRREAVFEYHEAELIRALRYFHELPADLFAHLERNVLANEFHPYVRLESALILIRRPGDHAKASEMVRQCLASPDARVVTAGILSASLDSPASVIDHLRSFQEHASHDVSRLTQYVRALRREKPPRRTFIDFVFGTPNVVSQRVYDYAAFLRFISTGSAAASADLSSECRQLIADKKTNLELKKFLRFLADRCDANLLHLARRGERPED